MIGDLASRALPSEVPAFLRTPEAARQIGEVAREPDRSKGSGEPHDADSNPAHYVDVGDDLRIARGPSLSALPPLSGLPANREGYDSALRAAGSNEYRAGYLPYAIIDGYQQLVTDLAYWRADVAGARYARTPLDRAWFLKDQYLREGLTIRDLGYLAHFVGDASQPMHVSVHRDGWGDYPNPEGFPAARGLHARFEGDFVRNAITAKDIMDYIAPVRDCSCAIQQRTADYLSASHNEVVNLYRMEKAGEFDGKHESGKIFVAKRLEAATSELRDLIVQAWRRSAEVSVGFPPIAVKDIESGKTNALGSLQGLD
jgi:hypothetical protein